MPIKPGEQLWRKRKRNAGGRPKLPNGKRITALISKDDWETFMELSRADNRPASAVIRELVKRYNTMSSWRRRQVKS